MPARENIDALIRFDDDRVVEHPEFGLEDFLSRNAVDLGVVKPAGRLRGLDQMKATQSALASAGWVQLRAFSDRGERRLYAGRIRLADVAAVAARAMALGLPEPDFATFTTVEAGALRMGKTDLSALGKEPDDEVFTRVLAASLHGNAAINRILSRLRSLEIADRVTVFGSLARGKIIPGDVDAFVGKPEGKIGASHLMAIAGDENGYFDPFLMSGDGVLLTRDETASGWTRAVNARGFLRSIEKEGVGLDLTADVPETEAALREALAKLLAWEPSPPSPR